MAAAEQLITANLDIWSSAVKTKSTAGRGSSKKRELYGIKKLRELILELAVRGLLVSQDLKDEPASELLEKIAAEKDQLMKDGKIKKQKALPLIEEDEKPADLPKGWAYCRLGDAIRVINGRAYKKHEMLSEGTPLLRVGNLFTSNEWYYSDLELEPDKYIDTGDLIYAWSASFGPFIWDGGKAIYHYHIWKLEFYDSESLFKCYVLHYLQAITEAIKASGHGIAMVHMTKERMEKLVMPVPPIAEQSRIVAKVDELMALCDQLEQQQEASITAHQTLVQTLLDALTTASERDGFTSAWARIADHFDTLFTTEWSIDQLKQTILQLAVMGKLVLQDPNDEPASKLLKKIAAEKAKLVKDGKIKKQKALPAVEEDEKPFELPEGWEWVRLGDVGIGSTGKTPSTKEEKYFDGIIPFIGPGQITPAGELIEPDKYLSDEGIDYSTEALAGDILMVCIGGSIGKSVICDKRIAFNQQINAIRPLIIESEYLNSAVSTASFYQSVLEKSTGSATPIINRSKWEGLLVPVCPLEEQNRIVAKVDELMALVDKLKQKLLQRDQIAVAFAQAAVMVIVGNQIKEAGVMKKSPPSQEKRQARMPSSVTKFVLRRFRISTGYRSLPDTECEFHSVNELPADSEPVCLVGLNGSGKSNLIEAVADVFCYLEMINLPWKSLRSASSKYRKNDHHFELEYTVSTAEATKHIVIKKAKKSGVEFFVIDEKDRKTKVDDFEERLALLPRRIIGYSSGLNETVSHPFLRTRTLYSEEVREAAPPVESDLSLSKTVFDTNTLYMDYENNAEILLCNYIFRSSNELAFIKEFTRVEGVSSFELKFNRKIAGKNSDNVARITDELDAYLQKFASCAAQSYEPDQLEHRFQFELTDKVKKKFREEFETAEILFIAMYKWSLLNALVLSKEQRNVFLKEDVTTGTLERPPVVAPKDRLFGVADVKVKLSNPKKVIDYSGLSDGEHQFIQVFGTVLLFNQPGTLFLLDEPESHFNPEWRTKFNNILNAIPNASTHEFIISTHSPYIVSGSRGSNVYKFTRNGSEVDCQAIDFETYGASFDVLLKKLFSIDSLIDEGAREDMQGILERGDLEEMEEAVEGFAESREKRRLYEAIIKKQSEKA